MHCEYLRSAAAEGDYRAGRWLLLDGHYSLSFPPHTHTHTHTETHRHRRLLTSTCTRTSTLTTPVNTAFSLFFSCTIAAAVEVLQPVTAIHHEQPVGSLHETDSLIPGLNYCLNEQETRTRTVTAPPSFTRSLSVSHPSPSLFHSHSSSVSITPGCLFFLKKKKNPRFSFLFAAFYSIFWSCIRYKKRN